MFSREIVFSLVFALRCGIAVQNDNPFVETIKLIDTFAILSALNLLK